MTAPLGSIKSSRRQAPENKRCRLLSDEENSRLFKALGARCRSLATAVAQVYLTKPPMHSTWHLAHYGIACFVKDNAKRSYYIRLYSLDNTLIWEQELYTRFRYSCPRPFFHTFEAEDCQAGLNFAEDTEASMFGSAVQENLQRKKEKQGRKTQSQNVPETGRSAYIDAYKRDQTDNHSLVSTASHASLAESFTNREKSASKARKDKKQGKPKLNKKDIGLPTNFVHLSHVGFDPNRGFALENVDPQLRMFFAKAGVSESQLKDEKTRDFIYNFIDQHGGLEAALKEVSQPSQTSWESRDALQPPMPPPVPTRNPPTPQTGRMVPHAPPTPPRQVNVPPTPPPAAPMSRNPRQPLPAFPQQAPPPPPPPSSNSAPPPPPLPPPALDLGSKPPPPPLPQVNTPVSNVNNSAGNDARSALLESIRAGAALKKVSVEQEERTPSGGRSNHTDLLAEIRQGKELKPAQVEPKPSPGGGEAGLAGALARALEARTKANYSDSDSSSDDAEDEDDWDD